MKYNPLMIVGTGSGVGKSILTAAFCRYYANKGVKVAPFKSQNMSLNSVMIIDGKTGTPSEISRTQHIQAQSAKTIADARMNPILLKPIGNASSVLVRLGHEIGIFSAKEYYELKEANFEIAKKAFDSLQSEYDLIILEGAGSPAEINLMSKDIVNMPMAMHANAATLLVGDINRGGVFAWLKGTYDLLEKHHKPLIKGVLINKFRGDKSILDSGLDMFTELTDLPVLGVIPWHEHNLEEEDSVGESESFAKKIYTDDKIKVAIVDIPRKTSHAAIHALRYYKNIYPYYASTTSKIDTADIIMIPEYADENIAVKYINDQKLADVIIENADKKPLLVTDRSTSILSKLFTDTDIDTKYIFNIQSSTTLYEPEVLKSITDIFLPNHIITDNPFSEMDKEIDKLAALIAENCNISFINNLIGFKNG